MLSASTSAKYIEYWSFSRDYFTRKAWLKCIYMVSGQGGEKNQKQHKNTTQDVTEIDYYLYEDLIHWVKKRLAYFLSALEPQMICDMGRRREKRRRNLNRNMNI